MSRAVRWLTEAPFDAELRRMRREAKELGAPAPRMCRWCGTLKLPPGRRTWCSDRCVEEFTVRRSGSEVRSLVYRRDRGVCAECGRDTDRLGRILHAASDSRRALPRHLRGDDTSPWAMHRSVYRLLGFLPGQSLWEADHIVPVVEGGGACGLDNYRTLCRPCHVAATAELRRRLSRKRNPQLVIEETA